MRRREFLGASAGGAVLLGGGAHASSVNDPIEAYALSKDFSGTILVARDGQPVFHKAFGLVDRSANVPCTTNSVYRIASITKLFTATLVMQLVAEGKLDLHARIRACLPAYKGEAADKMSVRQLLNHTSGIANFDRIASFEQAVREGIPAYQLPHSRMRCSIASPAASWCVSPAAASSTTTPTM